MKLIGNQEEGELNKFLGLVRKLKVNRYLEVGCRNGDTFAAVMQVVRKGGFGLAIDLPENADSRSRLTEAASQSCLGGKPADVLFGNSHDPRIIASVKRSAPFDLILIDADHRYDSVALDWENYKAFASTIAFHDIAAPDGHLSDGRPNGVGRFWRELKEQYRHKEFITPGSCMGFGIIYQC